MDFTVEEFEEFMKFAKDEHWSKVTEFMNEEQKEIYSIAFENAIIFAKTFIEIQLEEVNDG